MDDDGDNYEMVMPFLAVTSQGGPYDDQAYVCGYEAGITDGKLATTLADSVEFPAHTDNVPQLDLLAMLHGWVLTAIPTDERWTWCTFTRSTREGAAL